MFIFQYADDGPPDAHLDKQQPPTDRLHVASAQHGPISESHGPSVALQAQHTDRADRHTTHQSAAQTEDHFQA